VKLRLCRALIRSKTDCDSFVCGSARKSRLSVIDPVHNTGLRLATGAFRTSRMDSLYAESGEPLLTVRRNHLLCNYFARLATQCVHPSYRAVFRPSFRYRYYFLTSAPSTCGCSASRSLTATWRTVTPFYDPQTPTGPTLGYPTPYLRSASYHVRSRRDLSSHVPSVFLGISLTLPGPYSCVY
jgi:hypothetical protein